MIRDQYCYLTMANTDMDFILLKKYLNTNGISVISREKGFGGPLRNLFMGNFTEAHIEVLVRESDYETAMGLIEFEEFSAELDEELACENWIDNVNKDKKKPS